MLSSHFGREADEAEKSAADWPVPGTEACLALAAAVALSCCANYKYTPGTD